MRSQAALVFGLFKSGQIGLPIPGASSKVCKAMRNMLIQEAAITP
jgi:hypothetical protein